MDNKVEAQWNGRRFDTYDEAAKFAGVTVAGLVYRYSNGWYCDADVPPRGNYAAGKQVIYNDGDAYESVSEAARQRGVSRQMIYKDIKKGRASHVTS